MRVSRQEMDSGHRRIVEGAARLLRERGVRGTSVADAMNEAGMTHGGFYRHFKAKDDLVAEALRRAFEDLTSPLESRQQQQAPAEVVAEFKAVYLSDEHVADPGHGCPMPAIGGELMRESAEVKEEFGAGLQRMIVALQRGIPDREGDAGTAAVREICMMVGAVMLARASDKDTARRVLRAVRA